MSKKDPLEAAIRNVKIAVCLVVVAIGLVVACIVLLLVRRLGRGGEEEESSPLLAVGSASVEVIRGANLTGSLFQVMTTPSGDTCGTCGNAGIDAVDVNWCYRGEWKNALTLRDEEFLALYQLMGQVIRDRA